MPGSRDSSRIDPSFRRSGDSFDLKSIREYGPGDDVRHIDWGLFGRSGRLYIKEYFAEQREGLCILLDISSSVGVFDRASRPESAKTDETPRGDPSLRIAASIAWMSSALGIPTELMAFAKKILAVLPKGPEARTSGRISRFMEGLPRGGGTDTDRALSEAKARTAYRRVMIVSDFLDERFDIARSHFSRCLAVRLHSPPLYPPGYSEAEVIDPESGELLRTALDAPLREEYSRRDRALDESLRKAGYWKTGPGETRSIMYREILEALLD